MLIDSMPMSSASIGPTMGRLQRRQTAVLSVEATRGVRDRRRFRYPWRSPRPVAGSGYGEELSLRLIPSFFMRCLRVPGFNPSLAAAPAAPSMTQRTSRNTLRMCSR